MRLFSRCLVAVVLASPWSSAQRSMGLFDGSRDIGGAGGKAQFDRGTGRYSITCAGSNIWGTADSFYALWRRQSGDFTMTANVAWTSTGGNAHKKAGLMLRAGLGPGDAHASVMVHGDGLIALQYRRFTGGPTDEVQAALRAPARIRLARHGDVVSMEIADRNGVLQPAGALTVVLPEQLFLALAGCSHDENDRQTASFSGVTLEEDGIVDERIREVESSLETVDIASGERRAVYRARQHFEAPNWLADGNTLYFNGGGKLWSIPASGGTPQHVPTGGVRVNNDHGLSPDGRTLAISGSIEEGQSRIFTLPAAGGEPRLITPNAPSYWHGWSPDGRTLVYCASRNGEYDVYSIPAEGGAETRLTSAPGLDDGPEYSPDGSFVYFNSERSGLMRIWRMQPDGQAQEMMSQGPPSADWFPHPSPDGKWIAYLAYDASVKGHPPNKDVTLRLAPAGGGPPRTLVTLFGGQGTMNVPSWSPDSTRLAFVSYRLIAKR